MGLNDTRLRLCYKLQKPQMTRMAEIGAIAAMEWIYRVVYRNTPCILFRDGYSTVD
jgi:hypothetical protein